jgi:hypothetical protein
MKNASGQRPGPAEVPRVLLLVTTRKDAEISGRLLSAVGLEAHSCETLRALEAEFARGAAALLTTEEAVRFSGIDSLARALQPRADGLDLPTVIMTQGGMGTAFANTLLSRLQNITILERPAPVNSIISAVKSAVRVNSRQRPTSGSPRRRRSILTGSTASSIRATSRGPGRR